jgi:hypothetical protein
MLCSSVEIKNEYTFFHMSEKENLRQLGVEPRANLRWISSLMELESLLVNCNENAAVMKNIRDQCYRYTTGA